MSNPNHTKILFILDSSGSMDGRYQPLQKAIHMMLEQQARKLAGYLTVDVTYFDYGYEEGEFDADPMTVHLGMFARGGTQLYDSAADALAALESRIAASPEGERPGHVVVVIVTDGQSSRPDTQQGRNLPQTVRRLIEKSGWDFAFLAAAGQGLDQSRAQLGIPADCGIEERLDSTGIPIMADKLGEYISGVRSNQRGHF